MFCEGPAIERLQSKQSKQRQSGLGREGVRRVPGPTATHQRPRGCSHIGCKGQKHIKAIPDQERSWKGQRGPQETQSGLVTTSQGRRSSSLSFSVWPPDCLPFHSSSQSPASLLAFLVIRIYIVKNDHSSPVSK